MATSLFRVTLCMVIPFFGLTVSGLRLPRLESARPHCRDHAAVGQQAAAGDEGIWTHQVGSGRADLSGAARPAAEVIILWYCGPAGEFSRRSTRHVEW